MAYALSYRQISAAVNERSKSFLLYYKIIFFNDLRFELSLGTCLTDGRGVDLAYCLVGAPRGMTVGLGALESGLNERLSVTQTILVSIGIVVRTAVGQASAQVLITKRKDAGVLGGFWEFPGGKRDHGEAPAACVVRELREELGIETRVCGALGVIEHTYEHGHVELRPFYCEHVSGEPRAIEVADFCWVEVDELDGYTFPAGNVKLLEQVRNDLAS